MDPNAKWPMRPQTVWTDRVVRDNTNLDKKSVRDADAWEDTVLKEFRIKQGKIKPEGTESNVGLNRQASTVAGGSGLNKTAPPKQTATKPAQSANKK